MLQASLILLIITHAVIKLLTPTHANIIRSDLHLCCWHRSLLHRLLSALVSPQTWFPHKWNHGLDFCGRRCFFFLSWILYWPFPLSLVDWQLESLKARADMLLLWVRERQIGFSLHTTPYLLSLLLTPFFFFLPLSFPTVHYLSASSYISHLILNYWPVWSPVRLGRWWVVVHQLQKFFL